MRVFSDRWMAVTLVLPLPASRWPLPPPLPPQGSPSHGNPPPTHGVPAHHIYTVCTCAHVLTYARRTKRLLTPRAVQSGPARHLGTERKQSLSRLNPGVSFPLRRSSYSRPPPSDFGHNADGVVIKFQIASSLPCLVGVEMHRVYLRCLPVK